METNNTRYRYMLEHCTGNNKKKQCPACGRMTFARYIDVETGKPLADEVGRCDREINCGYHKSPKEYFDETNTKPEKSYWFAKKDKAPSPGASGYSTISNSLVEESMRLCTYNNFNIWLRERFNGVDAMTATMRYKVGGHNLWPNATVFWQIDEQMRVRAGKIMLYNHHTGHRVKSPESKISWIHAQPGFKDFAMRQCLFGLHLLRPDTQTIAIVEAEKTAVVASMFFPDVLFLATGGITNLRKDTCEPLKGHRVILFPDLGAEDIWREKARTIPGLNNCTISTWLTTHATDEMRHQGMDIADVLEMTNRSERFDFQDYIE